MNQILFHLSEQHPNIPKWENADRKLQFRFRQLMLLDGTQILSDAFSPATSMYAFLPQLNTRLYYRRWLIISTYQLIF